MTPKKKKKVLFLCTANAARSQMAEALARHYHGQVLDPVSAGSRPAGWVHPLAIQAMNELGLDMTKARSKSADEFLDKDIDIVVTVCDSAATDCPVWPYAKKVLHWPVKDPSYGPDDPATRFDRFKITREELKQRIDGLVAGLEEKQQA